MTGDSPAAGNPASGITHPYCVEHDQPLEWCAHWIRDVFPEALSAGAEALAAEPGIGDTVAARLYAEKALRAAAPRLLAVGVSAHRAEQDAVHADLSQLLRVLGMGDHARPQSSHEVMLDAINEVGRIRLALERAEVLVAERDRQWAEALRENERLRTKLEALEGDSDE